MKIIAKTETGWLLDVAHNEIVTLHKLGKNKSISYPEPGQEIHIAERYDIKEHNIYSFDENLLLKTK